MLCDFLSWMDGLHGQAVLGDKFSLSVPLMGIFVPQSSAATIQAVAKEFWCRGSFVWIEFCQPDKMIIPITKS